MKYKGLRILIGIITGFIALTAIGGGIALLSGAEDGRFPLEWLEGTPFKSYTIPALLLTSIVGGSSLLACIAIFRNLKAGILSSLTAGIVMVGFIVVEVLILNQTPPGPTPIEMMYFGLGLITFLLAGFLWRTEKSFLH
jgi:peptidoglycan/LPS O-acetylase OafA/YrhL